MALHQYFIIAMAFLIGLVSPNLFAGTISEIAQDHQVVLGKMFSSWTPSAKQTKEALRQVQSFLEKPDGQGERNKAEIRKILENKSGYRVQFMGVEREGKRVVVCNFFPAPDPKFQDQFKTWRDSLVVVDDGGFYFWQIEYDPVTGKCLKFQSNGSI